MFKCFFNGRLILCTFVLYSVLGMPQSVHAANPIAQAWAIQTLISLEIHPVAPQARVAHAPQGPRCDLSFIGFARNEVLTGWQESCRRITADGRHVDHYQRILLIRTDNHQILAAYRDVPPRRTTLYNQPVWISQTSLLHDNPHYAQAMPRKHWVHLQSLTHFFKRAVDYKQEVVRLMPDPGVHLQAQIDNKRIVAHNAPGQPMGFYLQGRLNDGRTPLLGHVQFAPDPVRATYCDIVAYHSVSGYSVAAQVRCRHGAKGPSIGSKIVLFQDDKSPLGSTEIGTRNMMKEQSMDIRDIFVEMHPGSEQLWDEHTGNLF